MTVNTSLLRLLFLLLCGQAQAFNLQAAHWPTPRTTLYVDLNLNGAPFSASGTRWNDAFRQAADRWQAVTAFTYTLENQTSNPCAGVDAADGSVPVPEDGFRSGVGFNSDRCGNGFGTNTLAVTSTYFVGNTTTETDITFNSGKRWDVYDTPWRGDVADFRRVAVHELGHVMGLAHEDSVASIMQTTLTFQSTLQSPTQDDIRGIDSLYGAKTPDPIVINLEEPGINTIKSGIANLRGWAVALDEVERVELHMDGRFVTTIPDGGLRDDVAANFPDYPAAKQSGFSMAFNYSDLSPGRHSAVIRVVDRQGRSKDVRSDFNVARFDTPFIDNTAKINLDSADINFDTRTITIRRLEAEGRFYTLRLQWQVATQSYEIVGIQRLQP